MEYHPEVKGEVSTYNVLESGEWKLLSTCDNQIQWSWGEIACHLFGDGNPAYKISAMYIEYENRSEGLEYYNGLSTSLVKDFLRVPMLSAPAKGIAPGYSNINFNQLTFVAQSSGTTGVHGKGFSELVASKIYGVALVAAPVWSDRTQDVVFARKYYTSGNVVAKQASSQIGVSWVERFK
jgi:hypothetical protein